MESQWTCPLPCLWIGIELPDTILSEGKKRSSLFFFGADVEKSSKVGMLRWSVRGMVKDAG